MVKKQKTLKLSIIGSFFVATTAIVIVGFLVFHFNLITLNGDSASQNDNISNISIYNKTSTRILSNESDIVDGKNNSINIDENKTDTLYKNDDTVIYENSINLFYIDNFNSSNNQDCQEVGNEYTKKGIYINMIYNPRYYLELSIVKFMLLEILENNKQAGYCYDYKNKANSTIVTVGEEYKIFQFQERDIISLNTKLLKDVLYNQNIFDRVYDLLYNYFRMNNLDPTTMPEYDRRINFDRYRNIFKIILNRMDRTLETVCRSYEMSKFNNNVCITPDYDKINEIKFEHENTRRYWETLMHRVSYFMQKLINDLLNINKEKKPCYEIKIHPEDDITRVLLLPHNAVKTADLTESIYFDNNYKKRITDDVILFKHRILHSIGMGHKYVTTSVMNWYTMEYQKKNAFYVFPDDAKMMSLCYGRIKFIRSYENLTIMNEFINDFKRFKRLYIK